ncbi:MAG: LysM peptidoglycan-binding domain-containing protein, partial [Bacteroidota bacterium]
QEALALASATRGVGQVIDSLIVPVDSTLVADPVVVADASPDLAAPDTTALIPPPAPVETPEMSTPEPLPPAPATATPAYHTVERGDTLFAIAQRYGVTVADLRRLNDLRSNMLSIGQRLRVR